MARFVFFAAETLFAGIITFSASRVLFPVIYRLTFGVFPSSGKEVKFVSRPLAGSFLVMLAGIVVTGLVFIPVSRRVSLYEDLSLVRDFLPVLLSCICFSASGMFCDILLSKGKSAFAVTNTVCAAATTAFLVSLTASPGASFSVYIPVYGFVISAPLFWLSGMAAAFVHIGALEQCDGKSCFTNFACISSAFLISGVLSGNDRAVFFGSCLFGAVIAVFFLPDCIRESTAGEKLLFASLTIAGAWIFRCPLLLIPMSLQPVADSLCVAVRGKTLYSHCREKFNGKPICIVPSALLSLTGALISVILIYSGYAE